MAIAIKVPRLGWTMEEGVFVEWLKPEGATVAPGDPLFVLEGEKAAQEIESLDGGVLRLPLDSPKPGQTLPVGAVLGYLLAPGETPPWEAAGDPPAGSVATESRTVDVQPANWREHTASQPSPVGAGEQRSRPARTAISPRARRLAVALGVDSSAVVGTGRTGRVRERDVRAFAEARRESSHETAVKFQDGATRPPRGHFVPLSAARRTIAAKLSTSAREVAAVTLTTKADATNLVSLHNQFKVADGSAGEPAPTLTDLIVKLAAIVLRQHPSLNASWRDNGIFVWDEINIGVAVDTEFGLVAPVVLDVASLGLRQLAGESRRLIDLARTRKLTAGDLQGGTFTVTNLGMHGVDAFTPIVNLPECAILGVGRIVREPAVVGEAIVPRDLVTLSLTFDHRVVDGAPAARFLDALRRAIEQPAAWLVG
jgi:pyruvate dehydrogenase E2 component (dihydrolipoamide acetyltransferase)